MNDVTLENGYRQAQLMQRKMEIEYTLHYLNEELRQLCLQEAKLTGQTPPETPLELLENPTSTGRRVGTTYQLTEHLTKNNYDNDKIMDLKLLIQLHINMAKAVSSLANVQYLSKNIRRHYELENQNHNNKYIALRKELAVLEAEIERLDVDRVN